MKRMKATEVDYISVKATLSSHLSYCFEEIIKLSAKEKVNVKLYHNGRTFTCDYQQILNLISDTEDKA